MWTWLFRKSGKEESGASGKATDESRVVWTGPSVRIKDGKALLKSQEMKRDLDAVRRLRDRGLIHSS